MKEFEGTKRHVSPDSQPLRTAFISDPERDNSQIQ
jgi:hypothetical protein